MIANTDTQTVILTNSEETTLSRDERIQLGRLEAIIERGLKTVFEVGAALNEIADKRLYRAEYNTFAEYLDRRWGFGRAHAYRLIGAAEVVSNLSPIGDKLPANEFQARPLTRLEPDQQRAAWQSAVTNADGQPTAAQVQQAAYQYSNGRSPRQAWELQNDMIAWLVLQPAESRLEIALGWQDARNNAPYWQEMVATLPTPWRSSDLTKAIDSTVAFLQRHDGELVRVEASGGPVVTPAIVTRDTAVEPIGPKIEYVVSQARVDKIYESYSADRIGNGKIRKPFEYDGRLFVCTGGAGTGAGGMEYCNANEVVARANYTGRERTLSEAVRRHYDKDEPLTYEGVIVASGDTQYVLRGQRFVFRREEKAAEPAPTPIPTVALRDAINASLHTSFKADAVIQQVFFHNSRPHITVAAVWQHDGREEFECYELVDLPMYKEGQGSGLYGGLPVSYVGHSYRLGNPVKFCYEPPAEGESVDPWELLAEKLAALDGDTRVALTDLLTSTAVALSEASPAGGEFVAAVVGLLMYEVAA